MNRLHFWIRRIHWIAVRQFNITHYLCINKIHFNIIIHTQKNLPNLWNFYYVVSNIFFEYAGFEGWNSFIHFHFCLFTSLYLQTKVSFRSFLHNFFFITISFIYISDISFLLILFSFSFSLIQIHKILLPNEIKENLTKLFYQVI